MSVRKYDILSSFTFGTALDTVALPPFLIEGSNNAHRLIVTCLDSGSPADLSGYSARLVVVNSHRHSFPVAGVIVSNVITFELEDVAYTAAGPELLVAEVYKVGESIPIYRAETFVLSGQSGTLYDPTGLMPSTSQLMAAYDAFYTSMNALTDNAEAAIGNAEEAADTANAAALAALQASTGLKIKDIYEDYTALQAGVPSPELFDQYGVGASEPYDIYAYTETGWKNLGKLGRENRQEVNVRDHGAIGDGVTNDTTAINAAIAAITEGQTLFFPAGTYKTTAAIVIAKAVSVIMDGTIEYTGAGNIAILTIGTGGSGHYVMDQRFLLRATRSTVSDWTSEDSVSIRLINFYHCDITIGTAANSTIGVQLLAHAQGFVYNQFKILDVHTCKVLVDLVAYQSGWNSMNLFKGGRFWNASEIHNDLDRYGIRIWSPDSSYLVNNNNVFEGPSFELGRAVLTGGAQGIPIWITAGESNYFRDCRVEECSDTVIRDAIQKNYVSMAFSDGYDYTQDNTSESHCGTVLEFLPEFGMQRANTPYKIFDSGPLFRRARYCGESAWGGHDHIGVPGMCHIRESNGAVVRTYWGDLYHEYIDTDEYLGVFVKIDDAKNFSLVREFANSTAEGRIIVRCYDAAMNIIDGTSVTHVKGSYWPFSWNSSTQAYTIGTDSRRELFFQLTDTVKYIFVGARGALRSIALYADKSVASYSPFDRSEDPNVAVIYPTIGTHAVGNRLVNKTPASGQPKAWICTVAGTGDAISTTCTANGTAVVVVASATGLDVGMFISINGGAARQIVAIDGTSITMDSAVSAGSGLTFVNSPATWESEGNL